MAVIGCANPTCWSGALTPDQAHIDHCGEPFENRDARYPNSISLGWNREVANCTNLGVAYVDGFDIPLEMNAPAGSPDDILVQTVQANTVKYDSQGAVFKTTQFWATEYFHLPAYDVQAFFICCQGKDTVQRWGWAGVGPTSSCNRM